MQEINTTLLHLGELESKAQSGYDYSKYKNLDDFDFDDELIEKFTPVAQELNLSQSAVESLLNLALEMSQKQNDLFNKNNETKLKNDIEKYHQMTKSDEEIPDFNSGKIGEYIKIADCAYRELVSENLKEEFKSKGLNYHPEMIKLFHKIGELMIDDGVEYFGKPPQEELSPAEILYGKPE